MKELEAARKAVVLASTVARRVQHDLSRIRAHAKDDKSPVTIADLASQAIVAHALERSLGEVTLVAEEDASLLRSDAVVREEVLAQIRTVWPEASADEVITAIDRGTASAPADGAPFFTLDPIDGTKGFLRGEQYAVSLARIASGTVVVGVLGCPNLSFDRARSPSEVGGGTLFYATAGGGAFEIAIEGAGEGVRIMREPRPEGRPIRVVESVEAAHTKHDASRDVLARLDHPFDSVRLDSQAKYAVVARGQGDVYLRLPSKRGYVERIWDHAAGALIATEAGSVVTDVRGAALDFTCGRGLEKNLGIVVAAPDLSPRIIAAIHALELDRAPT